MTPTYLPAPIKVQNNHINKNPDYFLYAGSSIALGILSYYAPKTFVATSVGIFGYQVHRFNQLVQTADATKHEQIHTWAIKACMVMWSIGTVFMIKSLPSFWSAAKDLRHLQLIHCIGHLAKGTMMMLVAICTKNFSASAKDLAKCRRWVEMEDYVENYPEKVKQEYLSSYIKPLLFYISALLPRTRLAAALSRAHFALSQFQPEYAKFSILQTCFGRHDVSLWPLAIHQLQQLSVEHQKKFGYILNYEAQHGRVDHYGPLPDDMQAIILNETLRDFYMHRTVQDFQSPKWKAFADAFEKLPREQQSILGEELLGLARGIRQEIIGDRLSEPMRLAALKASRYSVPEDQIDTLQNSVDEQDALESSIYEGLSEPFKAEYRSFQENNTKILVQALTSIQKNHDVK